MASQSLVQRIIQPGPTPNAAPLRATGRAGRNMPAAVATAVVLIGTLVASLVYEPTAFVAFAALAAMGGVWELTGAFARVGIKVALPPLYVGSVGIITCAWALGAEAVFVALYLTIFAIVLWVLADSSREERIHGIIASTFAAIYVPFFASFLVMMMRELHNPWLVAFMIGMIAANDTGGMWVGIFFGKHPMAPRLSPKKSWEGFVGSFLACTAVGVLGMYLLGYQLYWGVLLGAVGCVVGTLGDLLESLIKREVGLKDMSQILPGHGGILDRIDSMLLFAPVFYFIMRTVAGA